MRRSGLVFIMTFVALNLSGCDDAKKVTNSEFQSMLANNLQSMHHAEFVGVKNGKAYLKISRMSSLNSKKWTDTFFFTNANQLPKNWLKKQLAPTPPSIEKMTPIAIASQAIILNNWSDSDPKKGKIINETDYYWFVSFPIPEAIKRGKHPTHRVIKISKKTRQVEESGID